MLPTEKKQLVLRLGLPLSVLVVALIVYSIHRTHHVTSTESPTNVEQNTNEPHPLEQAKKESGKQEVANTGGAGTTEKAEHSVRPGVGPVEAAKTAPAEKKAPESFCFTVTYHHKPMASHSSDEACSRHRNLIRLKHEGINPASLCVRVNGTPVKYQRVKGHADEILIGAIAGPQAKITARYCIGKVKCAEDCTVPKDEFMDAIGGSDDDSDAPAVAQWDANDESEKETAEATAKLTTELKRELASDDSEAQGNGTYVFQDWLGEPEAAFACAARQARN